MRIWSTRTLLDDELEFDSGNPQSRPPADGVVSAIDDALRFVTGPHWVPRQLARALIESVRDAAATASGPAGFDELIATAVDACDEDPVLATRLTDQLLDLRAAATVTSMAS